MLRKVALVLIGLFAVLSAITACIADARVNASDPIPDSGPGTSTGDAASTDAGTDAKPKTAECTQINVGPRTTCPKSGAAEDKTGPKHHLKE